MYIIDGDWCYKYRHIHGDRRIANMKRGVCFPSPRISQFKVECVIPTHHAKTCFKNGC
jgi:hypothetical protein